MTVPDIRLCHDWLGSYLELTASLEAPESLHLWTGLVLLSAATRRKIYLDMQHGRVFPNMYIIIVAESARVRKSVAMDHGRDLLMDAIPDIRIMRDSMTSQGLIKSMNHRVSVIQGDRINEELRSDVAIFADEIANLFSYEKTRSAQMVIFLTRAYTCPAIYDHTTVRDATVRLHNLYPVLIGGTDPRNLKVLPEDAIGGLTGRLIWVVENTRRANNPGWKRDPRLTLERDLLREYLIHDLRRIANLSGEMQTEPTAMDFYDHWYEELSKKDSKDPDTDAFYHRCHTTALRLATLLSLSMSDTLVITMAQMKAAIALIELQLPVVKRVTMWSGSSQYEQHRAKFIHFMQNSNGITVRRLVLRHLGVSVEDFEKLTTTLVQDGTIEIAPMKVRGEVVIRLTKEGMESGAR